MKVLLFFALTIQTLLAVEYRAGTGSLCEEITNQEDFEESFSERESLLKDTLKVPEMDRALLSDLVLESLPETPSIFGGTKFHWIVPKVDLYTHFKGSTVRIGYHVTNTEKKVGSILSEGMKKAFKNNLNFKNDSFYVTQVRACQKVGVQTGRYGLHVIVYAFAQQNASIRHGEKWTDLQTAIGVHLKPSQGEKFAQPMPIAYFTVPSESYFDSCSLQ